MIWQLAGIFLNVLTPVLILIGLGYLAGERLHLQTQTLSRLAYYILVPAFVFDIISTATIEANMVTRMTLYIVVVHLSCALLGFIVAKLLHRSKKMMAAYVLVAVFGNVGNFGLPIIEFRLGEEALVAAAVYLLAINFIAFVIGVAVATWPQGGSLGAVLAVFKTPALLAMLPALLINWTDAELPLFLNRSVGLLAAAMIPTMLLTLGLQLSRIGLPTINRDVIVASGVRLVGGPILALLLVIPFGLTGVERGAGIFQASMPAAVLTSIIALEYDLLPDFVTSTVLFSTLASVVTLTIVMAIV